MPSPGKTKCSVAILGATGSIGRQALDVIAHLQASDPACEWGVRSLSCDGSVDKLAELARQWKPAAVSCGAAHGARLETLLSGSGIKVLAGDEGLSTLAADPGADLVLMAIFGTSALLPLLAALEAGRPVALASKEALVSGGPFVMAAARRRGIEMRPVDSEHSALWQCLAGHPREDIASATITASGGPFRGFSPEQLAAVSYQQALAHPVWSMGAGITINSATLFNKGLEVIEAHFLFGLPAEQIHVKVHPQGQLHAFLRLHDGSEILYCATPDMFIPIQYAFTYPRRLPARDSLPVAKLSGWELEEVDTASFPALQACRESLAGPWWLPAALVAVNEELCAAFQQGALRFTDIGDTLLELARQPGLLGSGASSLGEAFPREVYAVFMVEKAARSWAALRIAAAARAASLQARLL